MVGGQGLGSSELHEDLGVRADRAGEPEHSACA
jgi:hypothetical protein